MNSVVTCLNFDGNCRQAMTFYHMQLGGDLLLNPVPDAQGQPSTDPAARILHAQLLRAGIPLLMASDSQQSGRLQPGNNFSVSVDCDSPVEIEQFFSSFSVGGQVTLPLQDTPWGARFGMLVDQFRVRWMFNCQIPR